MSRLDRELVEKLDSFTSSLEDVVEILKQQSKEGKADVMNDAFNDMPNTIVQIAEDLREVKNDVSDIKIMTNDIKEAVEKIKEEKETGGIGNLAGKNKIKDSIAMIGLMAGSILAIGAAFKVVGKVDVVSVIALSASLFILSKTFVEIQKNIDKDTNFGDIVLVASVLPIMSLGLLASAFILKEMPSIGLDAALSIGLVSVALGVGLFMIGKTLNSMKFKKNTIWKFLALPLILPALSLALVASSYILNGMKKVDYDAAKSLVVLSLSIGLATLAMLPTIFLLDKLKVGVKDVFTGSLSIVIMAAAIAASGYLLSLGTYDKYPSWDWTKDVGLSLLVFGGATILLGGLIFLTGGLGFLALLAGAASVVVVAAAMVGVAKVLELYDWSKAKSPSEEWAKIVGGSIMGFSAGLILASVGVAISSVLEFFGMEPPLQKIAKIMVDVAQELDKYGDWSQAKHPSAKWAATVGSSIAAFGAIGTAGAVGGLIEKGANFIGKLFGSDDTESPLVKVAKNMKQVAKEMDDPIWSEDLKYPSAKWAAGVGASITAFGTINTAGAIGGMIEKGAGYLGKFFGGDEEKDAPLIKMSKLIKQVAKELDDPIWETAKYPSAKWAAGVGASITAFGTLNTAGSIGSMIEKGADWIGSLFGKEEESKDSPLIKMSRLMVRMAKEFNEVDWNTAKYPTSDWATNIMKGVDKFSQLIDDSEYDYEDVAENIDSLANSIMNLSNALRNLDDSSFIKLAKFSGSMITLSLVDQDKIENVIETLDDKKEELNNIISVGNLSSDNQVSDSILSGINKIGSTEKTESDNTTERFERLIGKLESIEGYLSEMLDIRHIDSPARLKYSS